MKQSTISEVMARWGREGGKVGGKVKSAKKRAAALRNLRKANAAKKRLAKGGPR